jgi:nitrate/nitrite transporter NarK
MNRLVLGTLLILLMFGHSYVLNQPQVLQTELQHIHQISVPQLNLLYSVPSAVAIFFILPLGIMYDRYAAAILLGAGFVLMLGQLLVAVFGTNNADYAFYLLVLGRALEGTTAEVLYMIQANLSSTLMGKLAGLTLILP